MRRKSENKGDPHAYQVHDSRAEARDCPELCGKVIGERRGAMRALRLPVRGQSAASRTRSAGRRRRHRARGDHGDREPPGADSRGGTLQHVGHQRRAARASERHRPRLAVGQRSRAQHVRLRRALRRGGRAHHSRHQCHRRADARLSHLRAESGGHLHRQLADRRLFPARRSEADRSAARSAGHACMAPAPWAARCASFRTPRIPAPSRDRSRRAATGSPIRAAPATP